MTPRFASLLAALCIAVLAYLHPQRLRAALEHFNARLPHALAPGTLDAVVRYAPLVLGLYVLVVLASDLVRFARESYREFRTARRYRHSETLKHAKKVQREAPKAYDPATPVKGGSANYKRFG